MTDHSENHVDSGNWRKYRDFYNRTYPCRILQKERIIDIENLNLLMHAVLWHDVGKYVWAFKS